MSRADRERLLDIQEAIAAIRRHAASLDASPPEVVRDAILYRLVVVGEAVKALSELTTTARPDVNWRGIAGLRDLLAHEYFRVDAGRIDELLGEPLDSLAEAISDLLGGSGDTE